MLMTRFLRIALIVLLTGSTRGDSKRREQLESEYRMLVSQASARPSLDTFKDLGDAIHALTRHTYSPADVELRDDLVQGMIEIPGHARVFAVELERQRELAVHLPRRNQTEYDRWRSRHFCEIFPLLQSPEMLLILGEFLDDERDVVPPRTPAQDYLEVPDNAHLACYAISNLGLRDAPFPKMMIYAPESLYSGHAGVLPRTRAWYAEVKSGRKAFSFIGKNVEYRFKPDGTWETTPLAISDEALREELKPSVPPTSAATLPPADSTVPPSAISTRWLGIAGAAALLIAAGAWLSRKLKR